MTIYGINPVIEALRAGRVRRVLIGPRLDARIDSAVALARESGVALERVDTRNLDRLARGGVHQGIAAELTPAPDYDVRGLVAMAAPEQPLLLVLDGIEDPHNIGAVLRVAEAGGCHGVVRQARHAAPLDGAAMKASAGAAAHVRIATVVNIARAIAELSDAGVWTVGLAGDAPDHYDDLDLTLPTAIVLGAEGRGLRRLVRERCDRVVSIPMRGSVGSVNVSVAAGIVVFEAIRQRQPGQTAVGSVAAE